MANKANKMKTIGIIGSRRRDTDKDYDLCLGVFNSVYEEGDRIVSGACPKGGDRFAEIIAANLGLTEENGGLILHRAQWDVHGRAAGFVRNTYIARDADIIIAVVASDRKGGTEDTIRKAEKSGTKVVLVPQVPIEDFDPITDL